MMNSSGSPSSPRIRDSWRRACDVCAAAVKGMRAAAPTGITPRRTQRGKYRNFTYPFGDRSQLIFWFEPAGEQQGLVYMIDVEE